MSWNSVHVYYHADRDALILGAVGPLFTRLRRQVPTAYFQRHWRRGPHVRLHFRTEAPLFDTVVRPAVAEVVGGFLAAHPSTVVLDAQALRPAHDRLAEAEQDYGTRWPWLADNSIHEADYDPRLHAVGGQEAADLLADFYVAANDLAFAMLDRVAAGGSRLDPCLDLMVATAHAVPPGGLLRGFVSFRSHAERFLAESGQADRWRAEWDRRYTEFAPSLARRVAEVVACVDAGSDAVPFVSSWVATLRSVQDRAATLVATGAIDLSPPRSDHAPGPLWSPFHQELERSQVYLTEIHDAAWFLCYRVMLNYLYLHMTRLGVSPAQRSLLCHLAANAAEQHLGVTAIGLVSGRHGAG